MAMTVLLALATATAVPFPSAPVAPPAPPMISLGQRIVAPPVTFDVDIRAGSETVWTGPMRVSEGAPAQFTRSKNDAPLTQCTDVILRMTGSENTSLTVRLSRLGNRSGEDIFQLTVSWVHPGSGIACTSEGGTRTVGLTQSFVLAANQDLTINGDGGLLAHLRRH